MKTKTKILQYWSALLVFVVLIITTDYLNINAFNTAAPLTLKYTAEHSAIAAVTALDYGINSFLYNPAATVLEWQSRDFISSVITYPANINAYLFAYSLELATDKNKNFLKKDTNLLNSADNTNKIRFTFFNTMLKSDNIIQNYIIGQEVFKTDNTVNYYAAQIGFNVSSIYNNFLYGFNIKQYSEQNAGYKDDCILFDLGLMYKDFVIDDLNLAVSALNLVGRLNFVGASEKITQVFGTGLKYTINRLDFFADLKKYGDLSPKYALGVNFRFSDNFHIMTGYNSLKNINSAVTIGLAYIDNNFGVQYAYDSFGEIGGLHYITISSNFKTSFGKIKRTKTADKKQESRDADNLKIKKAVDVSKTKEQSDNSEDIVNILLPQKLKEIDISKNDTAKNNTALLQKSERIKEPMYLSNILAAAENYIEKKDYANAENLLKLILSENPEHLETLKLLGDLYYSQNDFDKAIECYRKIDNIGKRKY